MSDQEIEDFEVDNLSDTSRMIPGLPPYDMDDQLLPMEPRSACCCWAWTLMVVTMNSLVFLLNLLLMVTIFTVVLLPTIVVVYFGFQCHTRVSEPCSAQSRSLHPGQGSLPGGLDLIPEERRAGEDSSITNKADVSQLWLDFQ